MGLSVSSMHRRTPFRCVVWPGVSGRWGECGGRRGARQWRRGSSRRELVCGGSHDPNHDAAMRIGGEAPGRRAHSAPRLGGHACARVAATSDRRDRKSTRLNSSHANISYAVFCLKKKKNIIRRVEDRRYNNTLMIVVEHPGHYDAHGDKQHAYNYQDRKITLLNSSHANISYAVFF